MLLPGEPNIKPNFSYDRITRHQQWTLMVQSVLKCFSVRITVFSFATEMCQRNIIIIIIKINQNNTQTVVHDSNICNYSPYSETFSCLNKGRHQDLKTFWGKILMNKHQVEKKMKSHSLQSQIIMPGFQNHSCPKVVLQLLISNFSAI